MTDIQQGRLPGLDPTLWAVSVAINLLSLALPLFILLIYDRILPNDATATLQVLTVALVGVAVVDTVLRLGRAHILNWSATTFEHRANCAALDHLLACDATDFERTSSGTHLDRLRSIQALRAFHGSEARLHMLDLPFAALFLALIWAVAGILVVVPIAIMAGMIVVGRTLGRDLRRALGARGDTDDKRQSFLMEVLDGIQAIKGRQMEALMLRRFERLQETGAAVTYDVAFAGQSAQAFGTTIANVTFVAVALVGAVGVINGGLTMGELAAAILLSGRAVQPMLSALSLWTRFQSLEIAQTRLQELFATKLEAETDADGDEATLQHAVTLKGVSYELDNGLRGPTEIDLEVRIGEIVGIAGNTSSGKSLLLQIIAGELQPTTGQVLFDGLDISEIPRPALRKLISHVSPNPALFKGTIIENLTLFRGPGHVGRALAAAAAVGLDGIVNRLPRGYDTMVAAGAEDELSIGIRHMLATARAIAAKPRLLLLDQVDNSLDQASDSALRKALADLRATTAIVIVSHRPSTLAIADRTYRLERGRLSPVGRDTPALVAGAA